jgi:hypothetical protein
VDWIYLAQDKDKWQALVKTVLNHLIPLITKDLLLSMQLSASQEGLCFNELLSC